MDESDWIDRLLEGWSRRDPSADFDAYHVTGRIARIAARLEQRQQQLFARSKLNRGEVGVLSALRAAGPPHVLSPTRLFQGLMLSSGGMTSRLDGLEARDLVRRRRDPKDRRGILVELTPKGRQLVDRVVAANARAEADLVHTIGPSERDVLVQALRKLLRGLEPATGG